MVLTLRFPNDLEEDVAADLHKSAMPEDPNATVNKTAHAEAHFVMSSREASNRSCIQNRGFTASRRVRAMAVLLK